MAEKVASSGSGGKHRRVRSARQTTRRDSHSGFSDTVGCERQDNLALKFRESTH